MSELNLTAIFGPRYELVIANDEIGIDSNFNLTLSQREPLRLMVGTGFNSTSSSATGTLDVTITAAEALNAYRAVGYDGYLTDPDVDGLSNYAGVTRMAVPIGDPVNVVRSGLVTEGGWTWTVNQPIFIGTNGALTQTVPSAGNPVRRIGWAISATKINFDPYPIIGV